MPWVNETNRAGFFLPRPANIAKGRVGAHPDGTGWTKPYGWSPQKAGTGMYRKYQQGKGGLYPDAEWIAKHGADFIKYRVSTKPPIVNERRKPPNHPSGDAKHNYMRPHRVKYTKGRVNKAKSEKYYRDNPKERPRPKGEVHVYKHHYNSPPKKLEPTKPAE